MKASKYIFSLIIVLFIAACAGGKGQSHLAALEACDTNEAKAGDTTKCETKACAADCSIFFKRADTNQAIWIGSCSGEDQTEIEIPATVGGKGELYCCAGDCDKNQTTLSKNFVIKKSENPQDENSEGNNVQPSTDPSPSAPECQSDTDCVAGSHCQGGACVDGAGPPPAVNPAPNPVEPGPLTVTIKANPQFDTRIGLVKLTWTVQGGGKLDAVDVYSDGFYRLPADNSLTNPCASVDDSLYTNKVGGKRRLLVHSNGIDLLSQNAEAYKTVADFLEGAEECTGTNCFGYTPPPSPSGPPVCLIHLKKNGDALRTGTLYTRVLDKDVLFHLVVKETSKDPAVFDSDPVKVDTADFTNATISLAPAKTGIQFEMEYDKAILPVKAPSECNELSSVYNDTGHGILTAECLFPVPAPPAPPGPNRQPAEIQSSKAYLMTAVDLKVLKVVNVQIQGGLPFNVYGIGAGNSDQRRYKIDAKDPAVTLQGGGVTCDNTKVSNPSDNALDATDCAGRVNLYAEASREFNVFELKLGDPAKQVFKTSVGLSPIWLYDANTGEMTDKSTPVSSTQVQFTDVTRNHIHDRWYAAVDLNGKPYPSATLDSLSYQREFHPDFDKTAGPTLESISTFLTCDSDEYEDNDDQVECGYCVKSGGVVWDVKIPWKGRHLKEIQVNCNSAQVGDVIKVSGNEGPASDSYHEQTNRTITVSFSLAGTIRSNWHDPVTCQFVGIDHFDRKISDYWTWNFDGDCRYTHQMPHASIEGGYVELGRWSGGGPAYAYSY